MRDVFRQFRRTGRRRPIIVEVLADGLSASGGTLSGSWSGDYSLVIAEVWGIGVTVDDSFLNLRLSTNGGSSYDSTASYRWFIRYSQTTGAGGWSRTISAKDTSIMLIGVFTIADRQIGNAAGEEASARIVFQKPPDGSFHQSVYAQGRFDTPTNGQHHYRTVGFYDQNAAVDGLQLFTRTASSSLDAGSMRIIGVR